MKPFVNRRHPCLTKRNSSLFFQSRPRKRVWEEKCSLHKPQYIEGRIFNHNFLTTTWKVLDNNKWVMKVAYLQILTPWRSPFLLACLIYMLINLLHIQWMNMVIKDHFVAGLNQGYIISSTISSLTITKEARNLHTQYNLRTDW